MPLDNHLKGQSPYTKFRFTVFASKMGKSQHEQVYPREGSCAHVRREHAGQDESLQGADVAREERV